jgi:hypothetical protein
MEILGIHTAAKFELDPTTLNTGDHKRRVIHMSHCENRRGGLATFLGDEEVSPCIRLQTEVRTTSHPGLNPVHDVMLEATGSGQVG